MTSNQPLALVLRTAGTNCDGETVRALELAGARAERVHVRRLLAEPARLERCSLVVIPGGFSYGDDISAGRVLGLELRHGLARELAAFVARGGFVLGVCNGFQVLVESGLFEADLSGAQRSLASNSSNAARANTSRSIALYDNASNHFECRWVNLRSEESACPWLAAGELMPAPVAHGEGRFVVRDETVLQRLIARRQIALRYVRDDGRAAHGEYPANPNGSVQDIAGICDPTGRVLGLMPHPERNVTPWNHPHWTRRPPRNEGEGLSFYRRLVEAAALVPV